MKLFCLRYLTLRRKRSETDEAVSKHQKRPALFKILIARWDASDVLYFYPEPIRMVTCHDSETDNDVEFITNNFEISTLEVTNLYRHRWDIEVFFKWIKQNIVVKSLWGYSENAVRTHLWVDIIAY